MSRNRMVCSNEGPINKSIVMLYTVRNPETGHTLGFPHEHMRRELANKIDRQKAIDYFGATQGWSLEEVEQQVLTPIEGASISSTAHADPKSIMCDQIPGTLMKDGKTLEQMYCRSYRTKSEKGQARSTGTLYQRDGDGRVKDLNTAVLSEVEALVPI